jgi:putative Mg2+ transporter-C (MgtC) family protein
MEWLNAVDTAMADWGRSLGYASESFVRLLLATLCGAAVGIERQLRGREAGFRTHALVCLGCALAMVVSVHFAYEPWRPPELPRGVTLTIDPARIAYGVMTGIGFLGAGAILKHGATVQGLTTAAGLWCVSSIGLAAGFGQYGVTLLATALVVFTLWVLDYVGGLMPAQRRYELVVRRAWGPGCVRQTVQRAESLGVKVYDASFQRLGDPGDQVDVRLAVTAERQMYLHDFDTEMERDGTYRVLATHNG